MRLVVLASLHKLRCAEGEEVREVALDMDLLGSRQQTHAVLVDEVALAEDFLFECRFENGWTSEEVAEYLGEQVCTMRVLEADADNANADDADGEALGAWVGPVVPLLWPDAGQIWQTVKDQPRQVVLGEFTAELCLSSRWVLESTARTVSSATRAFRFFDTGATQTTVAVPATQRSATVVSATQPSKAFAYDLEAIPTLIGGSAVLGGAPGNDGDGEDGGGGVCNGGGSDASPLEHVSERIDLLLRDFCACDSDGGAADGCEPDYLREYRAQKAVPDVRPVAIRDPPRPVAGAEDEDAVCAIKYDDVRARFNRVIDEAICVRSVQMYHRMRGVPGADRRFRLPPNRYVAEYPTYDRFLRNEPMKSR